MNVRLWRQSRRVRLLLFLVLASSVGGCIASPAVPSPILESNNEANGDALQPAPDFVLQTLGGTEIRLSDYRGQVVMLNFWASWCPPCKAEMADINTYYETHRDEGFAVIGINIKERADAVERFVESQHLSFPVVLDSDGSVADTYGVVGLPTSFFVSREGKIVGYWSGELTSEMLETGIPPLME